MAYPWRSESVFQGGGGAKATGVKLYVVEQGGKL